jgi:ferredoxin-NADP reductase
VTGYIRRVTSGGNPSRIEWRSTTVVELIAETPRVRSLVLEAPGWPGHRAGQHVDVRLTADDGYQAQRSYSIASAPEDGHLVLTVERIDGGEVSPYLIDVVQVGDQLELRGPIGGYFVWEAASGGPLVLVAGGSGIVPLRSMLRHRAAVESTVPVRVLYSARTLDEVIYRGELEHLAATGDVDVRFTLTRGQPDGWQGYRRRIDRHLLGEFVWEPATGPLVYVCGPTALVEVAADGLVQLGHDPGRIKTERFGPSGA